MVNLLTCLLALSLSSISGHRFVTYVDSRGIVWGARPPTPIVNVAPTEYTDVHACFYLPSLGEAYDFAYSLTNTNPVYGGPLFVESMHNASKRVILSVGGATETPTSAAYFTQNEPVALANKLAKLVKISNLDGVGIDWEDDYSNANPGLTGYGTTNTRSPGSGPAIAWLVTLTKTLRQLLPRSQGYTISHAPQAPYFDLGYGEVYKQAGSDIDYFTVQFYNQGPYYLTATGLVDKEVIVPKQQSCVSPWDGSITNIVEGHGVPAEKIVVGKIVTSGDGNSGYVPPAQFASMLKAALAKFPGLGGAMGWQWGSDMSGSWIKQITSPFLSIGEE
jgi:hypothetical protein